MLTLVSHPSRVRGLKSLSQESIDDADVSHPSRVRGLKFHLLDPPRQITQVAPFAGAWIEILKYALLPVNFIGRTLRGCVD